MIAVYEEKVKNGVTVRKVRLVADGRHHHKHGPTYAQTPGREELFTLLHLFATDNLDYYFTDQVRAFLSVKRRDNNVAYAKFYEIVNALYGMKTASRDHMMDVRDKLESLGFVRLATCQSIYYILAYVYVDDFVFGGSDAARTLQKVEEFRSIAESSEPELNGGLILGMEIERDKEKRIVKVTMKKKIAELCTKVSSAVMKNPHDVYPVGALKKRKVPMPTNGYIVKEYELEKLPEDKKRLLTQEEIMTYMSIVGSLIWIQGVRFDIIFTVLYLAWFTRQPRQHHMNMAEYCVGYLANTINVSLVLGGKSEKRITGFTDASLATGPNGRSITGEVLKLSEDAGAIYAKATASHTIPLSSFEAELDGTTKMIKSVARVSNTVEELGVDIKRPAKIYSDNEAMIKFVKGEGVAKGVRHMEMRMWYVRDEYAKLKYDFEHMPGVDIVTDKLTKLGNVDDHRVFTSKILGLGLLGENWEYD